ncbi:AraC family transcriptional regulator [Marssonina coronariae]|uniref:AraC family transcriptional regulator n=1 Tax=Diplocarpon coronariae TaxID=2795749 RepID=A0A218YV59_9HELO|nr:AraC family transcriptional regulator [Marssonina coronariae]
MSPPLTASLDSGMLGSPPSTPPDAGSTLACVLLRRRRARNARILPLLLPVAREMCDGQGPQRRPRSELCLRGKSTGNTIHLARDPLPPRPLDAGNTKVRRTRKQSPWQSGGGFATELSWYFFRIAKVGIPAAVFGTRRPWAEEDGLDRLICNPRRMLPRGAGIFFLLNVLQYFEPVRHERKTLGVI